MSKTLSVLFASLVAAAPILSAAATPGPAVSAKEGQMLIDASGGRLGAVDKVEDDGSPEIIIDGHVVTVPASTLSMKDGHLTTSLKKSQVIALQ